MNKEIYTIECSDKNLAELRYTIPLMFFGLKNNADVTALHVAEHCAFGDYYRNEYFQTEAKKFGGGYLNASINKSYVAFHLTFNVRHQTRATELFLEFVDGLENKVNQKIVDHYADEVRKELLHNHKIYEEMDIARSFLINNAPFSFSSGGDAKFSDRINLTQTNKFLSIMASKGIITLTSSGSQIAKLKIKDTPIDSLESPVSSNIEIKNNNYLSNKLVCLVLPKMSEKKSLELLYSMDYLIYRTNIKKIRVLVSNYSICTILNIFYPDGKKLIKFCLDAKKITPGEIASDVSDSMKEHFSSIENTSRFAIANWIYKTTADTFNLSHEIPIILETIEKLVLQ